MVYKILVAIVAIFGVTTILSPLNVHAADQKNSGLFVSPARYELTAPMGKQTQGSFKIGNYSKKTMTVNISIKRFSMLDFSYNYKFSDPQGDWIKLKNSQIVLEPGKEARVYYTIDAPATVSPGGHYFAFFASADMSETSFRQTAQVVSLLFLKVAGQYIQTGSIENGDVPFLNMGSKIDYKFDARNTGNIHYSAFVFGKLESLLGKLPEYGTGHILMPGAVRTVGGSVPSPLLPGIYKLTYGYKTDSTKLITEKSQYILFLPPWFLVVLLILVAVIIKFLRLSHSRTNKK